MENFPLSTGWITSHTNGTKVTGAITISGTASDSDGVIENVELSLDGGAWVNVTGTVDWSKTIDTTQLTEGEHTIRVRSYDSVDYSDIGTLTIVVEREKEKDMNGEGGGGGLIPGFVLECLLGAIALVVLLKRRGQ